MFVVSQYSIYKYTHIYNQIYICIYTYIYIQKERETERLSHIVLAKSWYNSVCIHLLPCTAFSISYKILANIYYAYIHTYVHVYMYISILMSLDAYFPAVLNSKNKHFWHVSRSAHFLRLLPLRVSHSGV